MLSVIHPRLRLLLSLLALISPNFTWFPQPRSQAAVGDSPESNTALREIVASGHLADLRWPDFSDYKIHLTNFYEPTSYAPAWVQGVQPSPQALVMIELFKSAWKKGLQPEDYDASRWDSRVHAVQGSSSDLARFDVALTVCTMRFIEDLRVGRINPQHFKFGLSIKQKFTRRS